MKKIGLLFGLLLLLTACQQTADIQYPTSYMIEQENIIDYQPGLECSAFASSYLLRHDGEDIRGMALFEEMPDKLENGNGVYPTGIIKLFQQRGYTAELKQDASIAELKQEISLGSPVIVYIHADVDAPSPYYTHYVPLIGYDEEYFYFAESLEYKANSKEASPYNRKTDVQTFEKLWSNVEGYYEHPYFKIRK